MADLCGMESTIELEDRPWNLASLCYGTELDLFASILSKLSCSALNLLQHRLASTEQHPGAGCEPELIRFLTEVIQHHQVGKVTRK